MSLLNGKKIFVTGGLGFIGSNLVKGLLEEGAFVKIYDNFSSGSPSRLKRLGLSLKDRRLEIVRGDILNEKRLTSAMKGFEAVVHYAAQLEITKAVADPRFDLTSNTVGTLNVLNAMRRNKTSLLLNASSACIYGQKEKKETPTKENASPEPNWAYGVSKLAAEKYCRLFADLYGFKIISKRLAIIYGENEWYGRVMTLFIKSALQGKKLVIFGDGRPMRDFTHVEDVVRFSKKALSHLFASKRHKGFHLLFNVSTAQGTTVAQLARKIASLTQQIFHKKITLIWDKKVVPGEYSRFIQRLRLPSELKNMILDNQKAAKILNWRPKIDLPQGLKRQILWAEKNLDLWKKMSY